MSVYDNASITNLFGSAAPEGYTYALDYHTGLDLVFKNGMIYPITSGTVEETGYNSSYGNYIWVKNDDGMHTLYAHLQSILVDKDDKVSTLHLLGEQGSTGKATGAHLHLEVRTDKNDQSSSIDPEEYMNSLNNTDDSLTRGIDQWKTGEEIISGEGGVWNSIQAFFDAILSFFSYFKENMVRILMIFIAALLFYIIIKSMLLV